MKICHAETVGKANTAILKYIYTLEKLLYPLENSCMAGET